MRGMPLFGSLLVGIAVALRCGCSNGEVLDFDHQVKYVEPYKYGQRTKELRHALLTQDKMPADDELLLKEGGSWRLKQNGSALSFTLQGLSREPIAKGNLFARTEDGKWHRFRRATPQFAAFLRTLPMQYDSLDRSVYDGREWLAYNHYGDCRRLVIRGAVEGKNVYCMDEDGLWHRFLLEPGMESLPEFAMKLTRYVSELHRTDRFDFIQRLAGSVKELPCPSDGDYAPPDLRLREVLSKKRILRPADDHLAVRKLGWSVVDSKGRGRLIEREGIGTSKKDLAIYARTSDGNWHRFLNVTQDFRNYIKQLPKHYDLGDFAFDGSTWYVRDLFGKFLRVVRCSYSVFFMRFLTTENTIYYLYRTGVPLIANTVY